MADELPFTERFGPNHDDGYQCLDELVQGLGKILRNIHELIPDKDAAGHADVLVGIITALFSSLAWRASDLQSVIEGIEANAEEHDLPLIIGFIEQAFRDHFNYDKSGKAEFRQYLIDRIILEEDA
jgi:hypothetical protein